MQGFFLQLIAGAWITMQLAMCALVLGLALGLVGAVAGSSRNSLLRWIATSLISIIRGLPELLIILFVYFGSTLLFTKLFGHYVDVPSFAAGVFALALLFGSYASQTFRGAFLAVPMGQTEAGRALGLNRQQVFFHIQLPQAWRHALPGLGNLWLILLKDTALVSLIGLTDLMGSAQIAASSTHRPFTFYFSVAVFYLLVTSLSQFIMHKMQKKASQHLSA